MNKKYNLEDAKEFVREFESIQTIGQVNYLNFAKSMKMFTEKNDDLNFKRIINKYLELTEAYRDKTFNHTPVGKTEVNKEDYSFLEFICSGMDNLYTLNFFSDLTKRNLKEGNLKKMFKEKYFIMKDLEEH
jgi:hypothetical protein